MSLTKKISDKKVNFEFNKEYINVVTSKIANNDALFITNSFKEMHPADAADIIEHLSENDRENLIKLNNFKIDPEVFVELNESIQSEVIKYLSSESIVALLKNLESDDAIQILENIDEKNKNVILGSLPPKDRFALLESLSYPEDSAARIMQIEFTAIPSNWSVGQTIDYLRENKDLPQEFLEIFIVNEDFKPIGTVLSSKVLTTSRDTKMITIMSESQLLIPVDMDKEEVGNLFDIANFQNGLACQKYRPTDENFLPVIKIKEMRDGFTEKTEKETSDIPEKVKVYNGDVLFSWSASLEVMIWSGGNGGLNQHIFKVTSDKYPKSYYYFELLNYLQHFKMIADLRKTTMGHITKDHLTQSRIAIPPIDLCNQIDKKISPILDLVVKNSKQNQKLSELRDWLLPMLMNGQVKMN